jgi:hypothetical protein
MEQARGAAIKRRSVHNRTAGTHHREERSHNRRHAGIKDRGIGGAWFERDDLVLQNFRIGRGKSGIDQVGTFAGRRFDLAGGDGECMLGGFGAGKNICRRAKYRRTRRPEREAGIEAAS